MGAPNANALVTGGGSGIGLGVARTLLAAGSSVTIAGRNEGRLQDARRALEAEGLDTSRLQHVAADMSTEDDCRAVVRSAAAVADLTAVVASAGEPRGQMAPVTELDLDQWRVVFDNNVLATMLTLKYGGRELVRAGGGAFVAISSIGSAFLTARFAAPISSAKAAIEQLCRIGAIELAPSNVTVNVIRPGLVQVPRQELDEEMKLHFETIIPMHRLGVPDDIAGLVGFLVGPDARWLTGQVIGVDGGQMLHRAFDASPWVESVFGADRIRGFVS